MADSGRRAAGMGLQGGYYRVDAVKRRQGLEMRGVMSLGAVVWDG